MLKYCQLGPSIGPLITNSFAIYQNVCVQLTHFNLCHREDICVIHLMIITIKIGSNNVLHCCQHFRVCESEVVVPSHSVSWFIDNLGRIALSLLLCTIWCVQYDPNFVSVCLHIRLLCYYHLPELSRSTEHVKCLSDIFCWACVWVHSLNYFLWKYMGCIFLAYPFTLLMIVKIFALHLLIIIKSATWNCSHCLGLAYEIVSCAICLAIFLFGENNSYDNMPCVNLLAFLGKEKLCTFVA